MIYSIEGRATPIAADRIAIQLGQEGGGMQIIVHIPRSQITALSSALPLKLFTSLIWRDTGPTLFGFATLAQVALFEQLNDVSGVGPKTAVALIDKLGEEGLIRAINSEDFLGLSCVSGVGKKTAQRIVIDLKGKCASGVATASIHQSPGEQLPGQPEQQALSALVHLGYSQIQSKKLVQTALESAPELSASDLIKAALRLGWQ